MPGQALSTPVPVTRPLLTGLGPAGPVALWVWLLLAGAILLAAGAGTWWWWRRSRNRRRARAAAEAPSVTGGRLRSEVATMADELLAADRRMPLQDYSALTAEFNEIAVEYRELTQAVERDPVRRRDADALSARVSAARERLERITRALDRRAQS